MTNLPLSLILCPSVQVFTLLFACNITKITVLHYISLHTKNIHFICVIAYQHKLPTLNRNIILTFVKISFVSFLRCILSTTLCESPSTSFYNSLMFVIFRKMQAPKKTNCQYGYQPYCPTSLILLFQCNIRRK